MSRDQKSRHMLRLRGWGRNGGFHGRLVAPKALASPVVKAPVTTPIARFAVRRARIARMRSPATALRASAMSSMP